MNTLEDPCFNYLIKGQMIYLEAGQPHLVLSPKAAALYGFNFVNPCMKEWENLKATFDSQAEAAISVLAHRSVRALKCSLHNLWRSLRKWRQAIKNLPQERTQETISATEGEEFVARQERKCRR